MNVSLYLWLEDLLNCHKMVGSSCGVPGCLWRDMHFASRLEEGCPTACLVCEDAKKCLHGMWYLSQSLQVQEGIFSELLLMPKSTLSLLPDAFSISKIPFSLSTSCILSAEIFALLVCLSRQCMMIDLG